MRAAGRHLGVARTRLTALGFTVAPNGVHPFGTANCCVYLSDGTFLEPLAIDDAVQANATARAGNVFTRATLPIAAMSAMTAFPRW